MAFTVVTKFFPILCCLPSFETWIFVRVSPPAALPDLLQLPVRPSGCSLANSSTNVLILRNRTTFSPSFFGGTVVVFQPAPKQASSPYPETHAEKQDPFPFDPTFIKFLETQESIGRTLSGTFFPYSPTCFRPISRWLRFPFFIRRILPSAWWSPLEALTSPSRLGQPAASGVFQSLKCSFAFIDPTSFRTAWWRKDPLFSPGRWIS